MKNNFKLPVVVVFAFLLLSCASNPESVTQSGPKLNQQWDEQQLSILQGLWLGNKKSSNQSSNRVANNPDARVLGKKIFFDKRFSQNGTVACASCHKPELYFTDGLKVAQGIGMTKRNTPTIVGADSSPWFFHDGRADSLWSQALGPLENELEHGGNRTQYARIIYNDKNLKAGYENLFGPMPELTDHKRFPKSAGPVKDKIAANAWQSMRQEDQKIVNTIFVNMGKAIAAYEMQLQPSASRFDKYVEAVLSNDQSVMQSLFNDDEVAGLRIFISKGTCTFCHNTPDFTDFSFHNIATVPLEDKNRFDWGRYEGAQQVLKSEFNCRGEYNDASDKSCNELKYIALDKHSTVASFKTPGLRNVSKTAPYMHDGQYNTLTEVLKHYNSPPDKIIGESDLLIPLDLTDKELQQLEAFLLTLNSDIENIAEK